MPTISMFYGIIVRMQNENGGRHHVPHVHCLYEEELQTNWKLLSEGHQFIKIAPLH